METKLLTDRWRIDGDFVIEEILLDGEVIKSVSWDLTGEDLSMFYALIAERQQIVKEIEANFKEMTKRHIEPLKSPELPDLRRFTFEIKNQTALEFQPRVSVQY